MNRTALGRFGEDLAACFLRALGMSIVDRNWRCRAGEIDIVARDRAGVVVFCEVKARSGAGFGDPLEALTVAKVRRLRELAGHWLREHPGPAQVRIDAVAVILDGSALQMRHVRGVE